MSYAIALGFLAVLASLAAAGFFLLRAHRGDSAAAAAAHHARGRYMARALALRVLLSVVLFGSLLLAWKLGYLQPTGFVVPR